MSYVQARQYENLVDLRDRAREEVGKVVVGQGDAVDLLLVAALAQGHVLIEGPPGSAKTLLGRAMAHVLGAKFKRIQFTPDTSPDEITGVNSTKMGEQVFLPGVVFTNVLLADEINRTPPRNQAALLEAMQERTVTVDGQAHQLPDPFLVIATQNPYEHEGIFPLPESQLDRFMFKIILDYADSESEIEMLRLPHTGVTPDMLGEIQSLLGVVGLDRARADLDLTIVPTEVAAYVVGGRAAHPSEPGLELGASSRSAIHMLSAAKAQARLGGRDHVMIQDVRDVAPYVLQPSPDLPRGHDARTTRSRPHSTARRARGRGARGAPPGTSTSGERLRERALREHAGEVLPELGRGRGVARRLGAVGGVRRRVGGRGATRDSLLDRHRPQRRAAHVRQRNRGPGSGAVVAVDERRHADGGPVLGAAVVLDVRPAGSSPPSFGTLISVSSSPWPTGGLEHAGEEVGGGHDPLAAGTDDHELGVERQHHRGEIGGRVAVGERAADRAAMTHLRVADLARRRRDDRAMLLEQRIGVHRGMPGERPDRELRARIADVGELGEPPDVDELRRPCDPELHRRQEGVPACQHLRVGIRAEQATGMLDRLRQLVVERCRDHDFASSIARQTLSGVAGIWISVTPRCASASTTALITAGAAAIVPVSPTPLAPNG